MENPRSAETSSPAPNSLAGRASTVAPLWSVEDVACYLGVPVKTLYRWRTTGYGPAARRIGKHLRYRSADVVAWVDALDPEVA